LIITLKSNSAIAEIETLGAELKSFKDVFGTEYIWCGDEKYWARSSPVLFPIVCSLKNDKTVIDGKEYEMKSHGFARNMEFKVVTKSDDRVTFVLSYCEQTLEVFPFKFALQITYKLIENKLHIKYDVINLDDKDMLFFLGTHPAFNCPLKKNEEFSDYILEFEKNETIACPYFNKEISAIENENRKQVLNDEKTLKLNYEMFKDDALMFENLSSREVKLYNIKTGRGVELAFENFNYFGLWTPPNKNAPFLCLEPWTGVADYDFEGNEFAKKTAVRNLGVNQKETFSLTIIPL
jgi:galactose mutarotase-like enzyme